MEANVHLIASFHGKYQTFSVNDTTAVASERNQHYGDKASSKVETH